MTESTFKNAVSITPHDTNLLAQQVARIYTAGAGTVTVLTANDQVVQFTAVAGGTIPIQCKRVNATGTAATGIIGLW
jgi:hypothetical protein